MKFNHLVHSIQQVHGHFQQRAVKAVNISLSLRNWLVGYYIVEFEQNGEDRASYGTELIEKLAKKIDIKGLGTTNLKTSRIFYQCYSFLRVHIQSLLPQLQANNIGQLPTDLSFNTPFPIGQLPTDQLENVDNAYYQNLIEKISFTHFVELIKIQDQTKRRFYEMLIIKTTPSVQELKKQINTLAYERIGLSTNYQLALDETATNILPEKANDAIKSIYLFDFLGFKNDSLIEESTLEHALLNNLEKFIQELGSGFCFEHRQKRILIDDEYYFADLVFYHRVLKCHVIIELKIDAFKHEHLLQLNTYVAYYNAEVRLPDDNAAIGILMCTEKGKKLVEYATAGMDNQLFVSRYLLELPKKEELEKFIRNELSKHKN